MWYVCVTHQCLGAVIKTWEQTISGLCSKQLVAHDGEQFSADSTHINTYTSTHDHSHHCTPDTLLSIVTEVTYPTLRWTLWRTFSSTCHLSFLWLPSSPVHITWCTMYVSQSHNRVQTIMCVRNKRIEWVCVQQRCIRSLSGHQSKNTSRHTAQTDWVNNSSQTKNPDNLNYSFSDAKVLSKLASSYLARSSIHHNAHHYPTSVTCCLLAHSDTAHT